MALNTHTKCLLEGRLRLFFFFPLSTVLLFFSSHGERSVSLNYKAMRHRRTVQRSPP